jgi:hypothetical protein
LVTLATVATLVRPASAPIVNTDEIVAPVPCCQEEGPLDLAPRVPPPSPSYHVHTPTPSPVLRLASAEAYLDYFIPSPSSSLNTNSSLSAEEMEDIIDQENCPPLLPAPVLVDPYAPLPCTTIQHCYHPHQYYLICQQDGNIWCPTSEVLLHTLLEYPTHQDLLAAGPIFPSVFPFKAPSHHISVITPTDTYQAHLFNVPSLTVCAHASLAFPASDTPLGYIQYSYHPSIRATFLCHSALIHLCFTNALIISQIFNFLDGC